MNYPGATPRDGQHVEHDPAHSIEPDPDCSICQWSAKHPRPAPIGHDEKVAFGLKDLAIPAAGLALMAPFAAPGNAQAAPGGQQKAPAAQQVQQKQMSQQMMDQIASFYAGKPVKIVSTSWTNSEGTTGISGSSEIQLNPKIKQGLDALVTHAHDASGPVLGAHSLQVLIHEAIHTRGQDFGKPNTRDPNTGFYGWGDEWQAPSLGAQLVPDAMQRFFGVPMNSPLGQKYLEVAKKLSPDGNFGPPPADGPFGDRTNNLFAPR
jgi:hypothetical protein